MRTLRNRHSFHSKIKPCTSVFRIENARLLPFYPTFYCAVHGSYHPVALQGPVPLVLAWCKSNTVLWDSRKTMHGKVHSQPERTIVRLPL